jgi:hypothetical protein
VTVVGLVEDEQGNAVLQFEEAAVLVKKADGRTTFEMPLVIDPGRYTVYLGVRDDDLLKLGTKKVPFEVPAFAGERLELSSILLFTEGEKVEEHLASPGRAFVIGGFHFTPKVGRFYRTEDRLSGVFHAYGYGVEQGKPNLTAQYIFLQGDVKQGQTRDEPFISVGPEIATTVFDMPLASFDPGEYTLRVKVTDHIRNEVLTKDIDFVLK